MSIRTQTRVLDSAETSLANTLSGNKIYRQTFGRLVRRSQKRLVRYSILLANVVILVAVVTFVLANRGNSPTLSKSSVALAASNDAANPIDQISSADIAVNVAHMANLFEATSVSNQADTVNAQQNIVPADSSVVAKPEIVTTAIKSRKDIKHYVVQAGDTVGSLATKFGITSDTIRWSNSLVGDKLTPGKDLIISPINGIVYLVKPGDTPDSVAAKFHADKDHLVIFNDVELTGLPVGQLIVVPDGVQVGTGTRATASTGGFAWGGYSAVYGSNGYDYGYCTWWAANRRSQIGHPIPSNLGNASTWKTLSQRAGIPGGNRPQAGAVIWYPPRDYYGHVGFVESVDADGTVHTSEMNVNGWARVSYRTISPDQAGNYYYIYW